MPDDEAIEGELRERLTAIVRSTPVLMRVLSGGTPPLSSRLACIFWRGLPACAQSFDRSFARLRDQDYDLGYFDASDLSYEAEDAVIRRVKPAFDEPLRGMVEVRNQARVHLWFETKFSESYGSLSCTAEALERFTSATFAVIRDGLGQAQTVTLVWRLRSR